MKAVKWPVLLAVCYAGAMIDRPDMLVRTRVVLHHPFFSENIGSVARAMRNMGLSELHVAEGVSPRHENAYKLAVGSGALLDAARHHETLEPALAGATFIVGTTAHVFDEIRPVTPREAAEQARAHAGPVAVLLGNEKNGLPIDVLRACHAVVRIPCLVEGASLNLAQAGTIVLYEWMVAAMADGPPDPLAGWPALVPDTEIEGFAGRLDAGLVEAGLFKPHNAAKRRATLRRILGRLRLEPEELALLQGVASRLDRLLGRQEEGPGR